MVFLLWQLALNGSALRARSLSPLAEAGCLRTTPTLALCARYSHGCVAQQKLASPCCSACIWASGKLVSGRWLAQRSGLLRPETAVYRLLSQRAGANFTTSGAVPLTVKTLTMAESPGAGRESTAHWRRLHCRSFLHRWLLPICWPAPWSGQEIQRFCC